VILSGTTVPVAATGVVGDYYLDKTNFTFYGPKTAAGWGTPLSLQGPAGPAGPTGPTGPQGPTGNANVIVDTFTVMSSADWIYNSQYSFETSPGSYTEYFTRYVDVNLTELTQSFLNTGMLLIYVNPNALANPNQWQVMPYRFLDGSANFYYVMGYQTYVGQIELDYFFEEINTSATLPVLSSYNIPIYSFKAFLISSTTVLDMKQAGINMNDYNQVSRFTGEWIMEKKRQAAVN
jgi:hypothetical protein